MKDKLNIPKTINVGFQTRGDTYTGKLAYVVYTDAKGVLRKESSWNSWRDKKIEPVSFENTPTSGFVINKKVGDYRGGWNGRLAWIRVYDPRDFEFEISVANLVFILQETSAIKGKGLEGEFVYAWDGADLVLLPVCSQDYKNSTEFGKLQTKKVTKADVVEGCLYKTKDNQQVMYLGRHDWHQISEEYDYSHQPLRRRPRLIESSKQHVFVSVDGESTYWPQVGFTKLGERLSLEPSPTFADEFEKFKKSVHGSKLVNLKERKYPVPSDQSYGQAFQKDGDKFYHVSWSRSYDYSSSWGWSYGNRNQQPVVYAVHKSKEPVEFGSSLSIPKADSRRGRSYIEPDRLSMTQFADMQMYKLSVENEQGETIEI